MPEGPAPRKILSRKRLHEAWKESRDATANPAGIDGRTAISFAQNLQANIDRLHSELVAGDFHFSKLRAVPIPKEDSGKVRIICVPTIRDRLVQRTIGNWLIKSQKIKSQEFVYGVKGNGIKRAIEDAIRLRKHNEWCVKTDIQAFFDNINREKLKRLVQSHLPKSSILPFLFAAIDREIRPKNLDQAAEIEKA